MQFSKSYLREYHTFMTLREELTSKDHRQQEGHHSPGRQKQAASLISKSPPIGLPGQKDTQAHCVTHGSC